MDLRAQARRGALPRLPPRRRSAAAVADSEAPERHLSELADALLAQAWADFAVDGEVVAFEGAQTSFARLQQRMQLRDPERARRSGVRVFYYLFDLLHLDGHDVTGLPLRERKALLRRSLSLAEPLRGSASVPSWSATTTPVARSATPARSARCYSDAVLRDLGARLARLEQDEPPFACDKLPRSAVHWVMPELVAQIGLTEVTGDRKLRHPRFLALRRDKRPSEVVLERPAR